MRKSMKKLIALTLACLMLATLFVGCGKKDDGGSSGGDTIKLGWMGSLTGDQAAYGTCESQTLKMMVEDLNANGGLLGKQVELICYDTKGDAQEEVKVASRKRVIPMIATRRTTEHAISLLYGSEGTAGVIEEMKREAGSSTPDIVPVQVSQEAMDSGDSAPTIRFVNSLIERAFSERASDIHLEPQDGEMVVRMRIDGLLRRVLTVPSELQSTVISRLKIMGGMNIAEHIAASLTLRGWSRRRSVWS